MRNISSGDYVGTLDHYATDVGSADDYRVLRRRRPYKHDYNHVCGS